MSLLEDIRAERAADSEVLRSLARLVFIEMVETVNKDHGCRPVVVGMVGNQAEIHFPKWRTPNEKEAAFLVITDSLKSRGASGGICAFTATVPVDDHGTQRAVILMLQAADWRSMSVHPFEVGINKVDWQQPYHTTDFDSPLDGLHCAN